MEKITTTIDPESKARWLTLAASMKLSKSAWLRLVISEKHKEYLKEERATV
jgi:hypothetical protein